MDNRVMKALDEHGWLSECEHIPSPNHDDRPSNEISLLVIHNISLPPEQFEGDGIIRFFTNTLDPQAHPYFQTIADIKVSSHFLIRRDGRVIQFVPCNKRAWHAGLSRWQGRNRCNDFSIGVELEGSDTQAFSEAQYASLQQLTLMLRQRYPLNAITGHSHIAPIRKTDPGPYFDWLRYLTSLTA